MNTIYRGYDIVQDGETFTIKEGDKIISDKWHTIQGAQEKIDQIKRHAHEDSRHQDRR